VPQWQVPLDEQLSVDWATHCTHVEPAEPQVASDRATHVVPSQHPLGHDVASQTHRPPAQRWPATHAAPPPQLHCPAVQPSVSVASHPLHWHCPFSHFCPAAHGA
jgi:hypothetical protein